MTGEAFGVMLVVVLGGLVMPIALILMAAIFEVLVVTWAALRYGYDGGSAGFNRLFHRLPAPPPVRPS